MKLGFWSGVLGATRYEFLMQIRRKALWIVAAVFCLLSVGPFLFVMYAPVESGSLERVTDLAQIPAGQLSGRWAMVVQFWMPVAVGVMLADRLPRDARTGVTGLLETMPAEPVGRLLGKYLGATLATISPLILIQSTGIAYFTIDLGDPSLVPLGLAAFLAVNLPGLLFVAAFSVSCPAVLWVPLYQFLFVGYWFWGNSLAPGLIPTLSGTWLTPIGEYAANGLFGASILYSAGTAAAWEGTASIGLLLILSIPPLFVAHRYLRWKEART